MFLASIGCASTLPSKQAEDDNFPAWSAQYTDRMLTDSPWARQTTVSYQLDSIPNRYTTEFAQIGMPGGIGLPGPQIPGWPRGGGNTGSSPRTWPGGSSSGSKAEMYLTTRWSSALPIRRALALQEFGVDGLKDEKAVELLNHRDPEYLIEVAGFPTQAIRQGARRFTADLLQSGRLIVPNRPAVNATSANVPEHGMHLVATLRFPRFDNLKAKDGTIELYADSGRIQVQVRFKLKEMVYGGSLEL
jgi:hypothetical protein